MVAGPAAREAELLDFAATCEATQPETRPVLVKIGIVSAEKLQPL